MALKISFESLVARLGFEIAVSVCDRELDEKFWSQLTNKQKNYILNTLLPGHPCNDVFLMCKHRDHRSGCIAINRLATTFDDWLKVYEQTTQGWKKSQSINDKSMDKLRDLATTFEEWSAVCMINGKLTNYAVTKMDKLASLPRQHAEVLKVSCNKTMVKVKMIIDEVQNQLKRNLLGWERCDLIKNIDLETEIERRHWEELQKAGLTWNEIHKLTWEMHDHPIPCLALFKMRPSGHVEFTWKAK